MKTYIVLLRGINVGGHKKVPMADLRTLLTQIGYKNVQTYIQSGNVILQASETSTTKIENEVHHAIQNHFGFDVSVIAKTREELHLIFANCPFSEAKKEDSYFILFNKVPELILVEEVEKIQHDNEEFVIINDGLYFYTAAGYGRTKFNMKTFEKILKVSGTSRNFKTMVKLLSLSADVIQ